MDYIRRLWGRDIDDWADIGYVLEKHGIKDAKGLDERLGFKACTSKDIPVVDAKNPSRLLGYMVGIELASIQPSSVYNVATMPGPIYSPNPCAEIPAMKVVRFAIGRVTSDGWTYHPRLETNDSLADLMTIEKFRLPGETARNWRDRWRMR